jgi:hypothetical protein
LSAITAILACVAGVLFILNVYQYLTQRAALRIADILYIMSRNVREKAAEVRRDRKDVEIVEAHLFGISTSARSLLKALGRTDESIGPDPAIDLPPSGSHLDSGSLIRLADNILYSVTEDSPEVPWVEAVEKALVRFMEKVPSLDREAAKKIISAVAQQSDRGKSKNGPMSLAKIDK